MKCKACRAPYHPSTGHLWTINFVLCGRCAKDWALWYKQRMAKMHARLRNKVTGERMLESFADCAAKSITGESTDEKQQNKIGIFENNKR